MMMKPMMMNRHRVLYCKFDCIINRQRHGAFSWQGR
jgi:hypothetical protein